MEQRPEIASALKYANNRLRLALAATSDMTSVLCSLCKVPGYLPCELQSWNDIWQALALVSALSFFSDSEQPARGAFVCWLQRLFALVFGHFNSDTEISILLHVQKWFHDGGRHLAARPACWGDFPLRRFSSVPFFASASAHAWPRQPCSCFNRPRSFRQRSPLAALLRSQCSYLHSTAGRETVLFVSYMKIDLVDNANNTLLQDEKEKHICEDNDRILVEQPRRERLFTLVREALQWKPSIDNRACLLCMDSPEN